jgi:ribosome-associated protein
LSDTINKLELKNILTALEEKKGINIKVLDVRNLVSYTDFMVLCSGSSRTHVNVLVTNVKDAFPRGQGPVYINPSSDDSWWVLDFVDIVVHIFNEETRNFYDLDSLWGDAGVLEIE